MSKFCPKCERDLPADAFYRKPTSADKLSSACRPCTSAANNARYHTRPKFITGPTRPARRLPVNAVRPHR